MSNEMSRVDAAIEYAVAEISQADAKIRLIHDEYMSIVVTGEDDEANYKRASEALKRVVRLRTQTEKTRQDLKRDALRYGKAVDGEANRIKGLIKPIEDHLSSQKSIVDDAKKEAARREHESKVSWLRARIEIANSIEWIVTAVDLQEMDNDEFDFQITKKRKEYETRKAELAELEEFRQAKAEKEKAERDARNQPLQMQLESIAKRVEDVDCTTGDTLLSDQVAEILISTARQIRGLLS